MQGRETHSRKRSNLTQIPLNGSMRQDSPHLVDCDGPAQQAPKRRRLKLLSYNVQTGIATSKYRHYVTHSWKHVLPYAERLDNLDRIAALTSDFDFVGLQEVDGGSLRSGFINQTEYLALQARFPYWFHQTNRNLGRLAQHSLGLLSRFRPSEVTEVRLPGMIPGRGALTACFGRGEDALLLMILHLSLGRRARMQQLGHISELVTDYRHVVLMGDLNCSSNSRELHWLLRRTWLREPVHGLKTFPSWRPRRAIDHILVSPFVTVESVNVLNHAISDHLPLAMEITLPAEASFGDARPPVQESLAIAAAGGA